MFSILLRFQTVCFCNFLNSCFVRNVVVQRKEYFAVYEVATLNHLLTGGRNAPAQTLRVCFPLTEVYECICCFVQLISILQQCQCWSTYAVGLECNGDTFRIRYIVQVQRNFCIFLTRCYNNLMILLFTVFFTVNFHSRYSRIEGCGGSRGACGCAGCGSCSSNIRHLYNEATIYIFCIDLGVVCANPVKQLAVLVVQLFPFENKREFVIITIFVIVLQFQIVCFCNFLNSCFVRNVVVQRKEYIAICEVATLNHLLTGGRNAPAQTLRVCFPLTEVYECICCFVQLISILQQCQCWSTYAVGLECNGDTFRIRYIVQVQRNFCIFLTRCYNDIFALVNSHGRTIYSQFCLSCSSS